MISNPFDDFVSEQTTPLYKASTGGSAVCHLLWGDGVKWASSPKKRSGGRVQVRARGGRTGWVTESALGGASLLEYYFIDVGQGDGILIKTPNFRHIMIDGGFPRNLVDTKKNAADFVDWKFFADYGKKTISLDAMIASHCDADHYGGLADLLDVEQEAELDCDEVRVDCFYHAGLSWWKKPGGGEWLGESDDSDIGELWFQLLEDRASAVRALREDADPKLHGWWADLLAKVVAAKTASGTPTPVMRMSHAKAVLPGFGPTPGEPTVRVIGPVEFDTEGKKGLRKFTSNESQNTNGVSLLLRVDYGRSRVLLTGDLNAKSQKTLLADYEGQKIVFECDVAKACHHGSEDVSYEFLQAMRPAATIISSGDNEGHDHPRPSIVAASATTGYLRIDRDRLVTPLVYSTELSRSVDLGFPQKLELANEEGEEPTLIGEERLRESVLHISNAKKKSVKLGDTMVVGGLIYGLVNVRTDGETILCATLDESKSTWRIKSFPSRF